MASTIGVQYAVEMPDLPQREQLRAWARAVLQASGRSGALAIRIVDEAESAALNQQWRGKHGPTNVLSFAMELPAGVPVAELGDVVICAPVVAREAAQQHKAVDAHWAHMVVHGMLHLLGHDHQDEPDAMRMERLEAEILEGLGFDDPYRIH
jgi:probable rRNA maturation factor